MILIANTKGGSGKSTTAMQLIAPWALERLGTARVVEMDDENHDSASFTKSAIDTKRLKVGKDVNASFSIDSLINETEKGYVIADIGGNRTCSMVLEELGKGGYDTFVDLIVVPVSSAGQDVVNANKTLKKIKDAMPDYKGKIVMVITRTSTDDIDMLRAMTGDAFALIENQGLYGPLILPGSSCFAISRWLGLTVWEIIGQADDLTQQLRAGMADARGKPQERQRLADLTRIVNDSKGVAEHLKSQFNELDKIIDLKAAVKVNEKQNEKAPKAEKAENTENTEKV